MCEPLTSSANVQVIKYLIHVLRLSPSSQFTEKLKDKFGALIAHLEIQLNGFFSYLVFLQLIARDIKV